MTVYACCQTNVVSVKPDATVQFVAGLMKEKNIGCVVVTDDHRPVGIVTDRDIALRSVTLCNEPEMALIESIMTRDPMTIRKDTGIFDAIKEMKRSGVRS